MTQTQSKTTHTLGPWEVREFCATGIAIAQVGFMPHAEVYRRGAPDLRLDDQARVNARLIAAAPDLLAECKAVQNWLREYIWQHRSDPMDGGLAEMHNSILAAIARAEA